MDFNTGSGSERPDDQSRPLFGGETGGPRDRPPRGPVGGTVREFTIQDPVGSFIGTVQNIVLNPVGFFRGIAKRGDFVNPLIFALICYEISTLLGGLIGLLFTGLLGPTDVGGGQDLGFFGGIGGFVLSLILAPIFGAIFVFIAAGVFHLLTILIIGAGNSGFEATTRVVSYSFVYQLVSWIPFIGWIVAPIYGIVLSIFGIREVHATTTGKAALVVLIPVAVALVLLIIFGLLLGALFVTLLQQQ